MHDDTQFREFVAAYPAARRVSTPRAHRAFVQALQWTSFETLLTALEQHKRSEQWGRHVIPSIEKWLEEGRWQQTLPEPKTQNRRTPFEQARHDGLKKW